MSDKPLIQQALASELAEILLKIPSAVASLDFLSGFWEVTVREWNGIDRLRYAKSFLTYLAYIFRIPGWINT
jgi:ribosomal RNA-processing protein 1